MKANSSQLIKPIPKTANVVANINYEMVDEQIKSVLSNNFEKDRSSWRMAGLMFYSIHKQTVKIDNDLKQMSNKLTRKSFNSISFKLQSLFASPKLSHLQMDVDNMSKEDIVNALISDNLKLSKKAYEMTKFSQLINDDPSVSRVKEMVTKITENVERLNYYVSI